MSYTDADKEKWRTGLYAANPQQARDLVDEIDTLRRMFDDVAAVADRNSRAADAHKFCANERAVEILERQELRAAWVEAQKLLGVSQVPLSPAGIKTTATEIRGYLDEAEGDADHLEAVLAQYLGERGARAAREEWRRGSSKVRTPRMPPPEAVDEILARGKRQMADALWAAAGRRRRSRPSCSCDPVEGCLCWTR